MAGKQEGMIRGKTRSGLLYECERIIEHCRPKYLLLENVKNLVGKKFKPQFDEWLKYLEGLGYTSYWSVLNAKDYGVPQNRERVFVVSILGEHEPYVFPQAEPLHKCLADILEDNVDKKYYVPYSKPLPDWDFSKDIIGKLDIGNYDLNNRVYGLSSCGFTLRAKKSDQKILTKDEKLRYLTPKECFKLMGMKDSHIDKIQSIGMSDTQQYKMAGNSIVINVLEAIFRNLFL